ncbi:hypothetical protein HaLaN_14703 [Haematococcus lacustris]|uniref:Uncharacterized protein n=1 Tax=Haematococcus lacustris TaxID=44745 RepID=A0A699Z5Z3_HAELA|nr:hypothetical protein HaLaN_14703 [Haematococcus lacustris]
MHFKTKACTFPLLVGCVLPRYLPPKRKQTKPLDEDLVVKGTEADQLAHLPSAAFDPSGIQCSRQSMLDLQHTAPAALQAPWLEPGRPDAPAASQAGTQDWHWG